MATLIGYDPVTGEEIWDDPALNPPPLEPLPTLEGTSPSPDDAPQAVVWDTAVYMVSTQEQPDPLDVPSTTHQGIQFTDREVTEVVAAAQWIRQQTRRPVVVVLLNVDGVDNASAPVYKVDLTADPIKITSARS